MTEASMPQSARFTATDDKMWAALSHFGGVLWFIPSLLIFVALRRRGTLTRQESKEALNWQITFTLGYVVLVLLAAIASAILYLARLGDLVSLMLALPFALYIANVFLSISAGARVNAGGAYRYPFAIRLIK